jgi:hypothetical protein
MGWSDEWGGGEGQKREGGSPQAGCTNLAAEAPCPALASSCWLPRLELPPHRRLDGELDRDREWDRVGIPEGELGDGGGVCSTMSPTWAPSLLPASPASPESPVPPWSRPTMGLPRTACGWWGLSAIRDAPAMPTCIGA